MILDKKEVGLILHVSNRPLFLFRNAAISFRTSQNIYDKVVFVYRPNLLYDLE
jgi:hypothetical protein